MANRDLFHLVSGEAAAMKSIAYYEAFHKARYDYVVRTCLAVCPDRSVEVLDVGRSTLTLRLLEQYDRVSTLGFRLGPRAPMGLDLPDGSRKAIGPHILYDLNAAQKMTPVPTDARFGLIVFAEVLEHLYTSPELTLRAMKDLLAPGGILVVQTPNAAAFDKRVRLLFGRNPYELIRVSAGNPGHYREYTKAELLMYARKLEMQIVSHAYRDYFGGADDFVGTMTIYALKAIGALIPSLARGQTLVLRKPV